MGERARLGSGPRRRAVAGFTLLELLVTLLVLALAVGLVVPMVGRSTETVRARAEVAAFAALLRHAREQAITRREPHAVVVDPTARRVTLVAGETVRESRSLPERLTVEAIPPPALSVRFDPSGLSTGADFRVTTGAVRYRVTVDALTGRVRSERE